MGIVDQQQKDAVEKQKSVNDAWNLLAMISEIVATGVAVNVGTTQAISQLNTELGLNVPSPTNHGIVAKLDSSQALIGFEGLAVGAAVMGTFTSSSALHSYLHADKKEHLRAAVNFVQYVGSVMLAGAGIAMLAGASASVFVLAMPYVIMALVAVNVLYSLGLMFANLWHAVNAKNSKEQKEHLKAALNNLVSLVLNALIILTVVLFLGPLFAAIKAAAAGNTAALAAVFSNPLQILLASTLVITLVAAVSKTLAGAKAAIVDAWKDPATALSNLFENDIKVWDKVVKTFKDSPAKAKAKAVAYAVLAVAILPARMALLVLKAAALLLMAMLKKLCSAKIEKTSALTSPASPALFVRSASEGQIQGQRRNLSPIPEEAEPAARPRADSLPGVREMEQEPLSPQPAPEKRPLRIPTPRARIKAR